MQVLLDSGDCAVNLDRLPPFLIALCISGLIWQMPVNLILFLPVVFVWLAVSWIAAICIWTAYQEWSDND